MPPGHGEWANDKEGRDGCGDQGSRGVQEGVSESVVTAFKSSDRSGGRRPSKNKEARERRVAI